jgi:hypothetical protein
MAEGVITEYTGPRGGPVARYYEYDREGVRVLDGRRTLKRLYRFDPAEDMMTERDPVRIEKILRRFLFDRYGMLEETFAPGHRPRTFRYEAGGRRIAVREGGEFGAVGKLFRFEDDGISETEWGRDGEIERVFVFDAGGDAITERAGGWYGTPARTLVFEGMNASVFREPESFLQLLMFAERCGSETTAAPRSAPVPDRNRYEGVGAARGRVPDSLKQGTGSVQRKEAEEDSRIDIIPDADARDREEEPEKPPERKSSEISYEERRAGKKY